MFVSGSGVRSIWLRHDLEDFKKRLKAIEDKVASEVIILTDSQIAVLEKKKSDDDVTPPNLVQLFCRILCSLMIINI